MGRQVNFYLTQMDQVDLERKIRSHGEFFSIGAKTTNGKPQILDSTVIKNMGREYLAIYLVRPSDLTAIRWTGLSEQDHKSVDEQRSPVIEFVRCYQGPDYLTRGRLYYQGTYFDSDGNVVSKNQEFLTWADSVIKLVRRVLSKGPGSEYLGPQVRELCEKGFQLKPFGRSSNK